MAELAKAIFEVVGEYEVGHLVAKCGPDFMSLFPCSKAATGIALFNVDVPSYCTDEYRVIKNLSKDKSYNADLEKICNDFNNHLVKIGAKYRFYIIIGETGYQLCFYKYSKENLFKKFLEENVNSTKISWLFVDVTRKINSFFYPEDKIVVPVITPRTPTMAKKLFPESFGKDNEKNVSSTSIQTDNDKINYSLQTNVEGISYSVFIEEGKLFFNAPPAESEYKFNKLMEGVKEIYGEISIDLFEKFKKINDECCPPSKRELTGSMFENLTSSVLDSNGTTNYYDCMKHRQSGRIFFIMDSNVIYLN